MATLPAELASQIDEAEFARIVGRINRFLADAERNTNDIYLQVGVICTYPRVLTPAKNCLACFGGVLFLACIQNPYDKVGAVIYADLLSAKGGLTDRSSCRRWTGISPTRTRRR